MIKVGLTGGIGSGKTTIANFFELLNVPVYYSDIEAKRLMINNISIKQNLINLLGAESYLESGDLNKVFISKMIFADKHLLNEMNKIVHPVVKKDFETFCEINSTKKYIIKESAILVETGLYKNLDKLILVTASEEERIKRVGLRDSIDTEDIKAKITKQMTDIDKMPFANYIIGNNNLSFTIPQILDIHNQLIHL